MQWVYLILFIISLSLIVYNYLVYPVIIVLLSKLRHKPVTQFTDNEQLPSLTLVVSAFQSNAVLEKKIQNCLRLYYPKGALQIIFVSDKQNERAQLILSRYRKQGISNLRKNNLLDHEQAFHLGGKLAQGNIIVFSTPNTDLNDMALVALAKNFRDKKIAAVSGMHSFYESRNSHTSKSNSLYCAYEAIIKRAESKLGSITSADSEILAVRKPLFTGFPDRQFNYDDTIVYRLVKKGFRVIYEPLANAISQHSIDIKQDFKSTSRRAASSYRLSFSEWSNIFPPKTLFRFMFFSHRVLHLFVPLLLAIVLATSIMLYENMTIRILLFMQIAMYSFTLINWLLRKTSVSNSYTSSIMYFVMMNIALFAGYMKYLWSGIKSLFTRNKQLKQST